MPLRSRSDLPLLFVCPENGFVQRRVTERQKLSQGGAWMPAPECPVLSGIPLGKDLEPPFGQEILEEEGSCLPRTWGWWLSLSPGPRCHQATFPKQRRCPRGAKSHVPSASHGLGCEVAPKITRCQPQRQDGDFQEVPRGKIPWMVGMEQPLPTPAGAPARNDSGKEEGGRGLFVTESRLHGPLCCYYIYLLIPLGKTLAVLDLLGLY